MKFNPKGDTTLYIDIPSVGKFILETRYVRQHVWNLNMKKSTLKELDEATVEIFREFLKDTIRLSSLNIRGITKDRLSLLEDFFNLISK